MGYRPGPVLAVGGNTGQGPPPRQAWAEARFGVGLVKEALQHVSGRAAPCHPTVRLLSSFTPPHPFLRDLMGGGAIVFRIASFIKTWSTKAIPSMSLQDLI